MIVLASVALSAGIIRGLDDLEESYDYVIAGGGLSGLVVAARLSEALDGEYLLPWRREHTLANRDYSH